MNHLVLVDANNVGFASMSGPRLHSGKQETQGVFSFIRTLRKIYLEYPDAYIILLWDGASWRKDIYKEYKDKRQSTEKQQAARSEYFDQKVYMTKAARALGVTQARADNMEADDLAEYYSSRWKGNKVTLVSGDQDWIQLVDDKVSWYDQVNERWVTNANFTAFTGFKDPKQFVEAKSVLGDKDEVPGIKGVGPKVLDIIYGGFKMSFREFLDYNKSYPKEASEEWKRLVGKNKPKLLDTISCVDTFTKLAFNDSLGDLRTPLRPKPVNLTLSKYAFNKEDFTDLAYEMAFLSITRDINRYVEPFVKNNMKYK